MWDNGVFYTTHDPKFNVDHIASAIETDLGTSDVVLVAVSNGGDIALQAAVKAEAEEEGRSSPYSISGLIFFDPATAAYSVDPDTGEAVPDPLGQVDVQNGSYVQQKRAVPAGVGQAIDCSREIFYAYGAQIGQLVDPDNSPHAFLFSGTAEDSWNLDTFPNNEQDEDHAWGQCTPEVPALAHYGLVHGGRGGPGDPINDTSEFLEDAVEGFPMYWGNDIKV
jgi:pimeloyl-ACP methyl ester carboxylesterase